MKTKIEKVYYKDRPMAEDFAGAIMDVTFTHMYAGSLAFSGGKRRHICLIEGYWCWHNALEHPKDILRFLKYKYRRAQK